MNVGAMRHRVGMLEAALEAFVLQRHVDDRVARERAAHLHRRRPMGIGEHGILEPDLVKRPENIRAELDAGADLPKLRGLLEDADRKAVTGERIASRQPPDAAASNENGLPASVLSHLHVLRDRALVAICLPARGGSIARRRHYRAEESIAWTRNPRQMQRPGICRAKRAKRARPPKGCVLIVIAGGGGGPRTEGGVSGVRGPGSLVVGTNR